MNAVPNFTKFADELLTKATIFDQAHLEEGVDDNDALRTEVLRAFVEQWLEEKLTSATAARINKLTIHPDDIDGEEIAPKLESLLGGN